jgi:pantetheine-phosphate adenylyltransferase
MKRAIYAGSFDPVTNGHLDVLRRAAKVFDEVIVAIAHNSEKRGLFTVEERLTLLREATGDVAKVRVVQFEGLLVQFAVREGACAIVRGLRAVSDFEFEFQMALMNRRLEPALETFFLMPKEEYSYVSSRLVKEVASLGGDVTAFVPGCVVGALREKYAAG